MVALNLVRYTFNPAILTHREPIDPHSFRHYYRQRGVLHYTSVTVHLNILFEYS